MIENNILEIKPNKIAIDPVTLRLIKNTSDESIFLTNFYLDPEDNEVTTIGYNKKQNLEYRQNYMLYPSIFIEPSTLLVFHDIIDINDIINYINKSIDKELYETVNRILNCWIRENFNYLKKNNKILKNIYSKIFKKYFDIELKDIDYSKFFDKWFEIKNQNDFDLNLGNDFKNFLSKKYEP
jgi:hypothetical protein